MNMHIYVAKWNLLFECIHVCTNTQNVNMFEYVHTCTYMYM